MIARAALDRAGQCLHTPVLDQVSQTLVLAVLGFSWQGSLEVYGLGSFGMKQNQKTYPSCQGDLSLIQSHPPLHRGHWLLDTSAATLGSVPAAPHQLVGLGTRGTIPVVSFPL